MPSISYPRTNAMKKAITLHWNLSGFAKGEAVAFRVELAQGLDSGELRSFP